MEIAELVLKYMKALAWPLGAAIMAYLFRDQVRDALRRAMRIEVKRGGVVVVLAAP
ncbi:hypothetical protein ABT299_17430 [Spirillospora sp. NPDC000708]